MSIQLILSLIYHVYHYLIQFFLFIFQPILSLIEFVVYLLHATFSLLIPGGLVTILIGEFLNQYVGGNIIIMCIYVPF